MNLITPDLGIIFWQTITFLVVLLILKKFAWNKILDFIEQREKKIQKAIDAAHKAEDEFKNIENKSKNIIQKAHIDSENIIKEAISIKNKIISESEIEAQKTADEVIDKTKFILAQEKKLATLEIKKDISKLIIDTAEKVVELKIEKTPEIQQIIEESLLNIEKN